MLTAFQRQLIYFPQTASEPDLVSEATAVGWQPWRDTDGGLIGWRPADKSNAARRMLVFHGNAGYALHRTYFAAGLGEDWEVLLFEYPGYGARGGKPSAESIKAAASEAVKALTQEDAPPVYLLGESLGSGVASYLAGAFPQQIAGVLLVTPFTRLSDVASHHYPWLPVRALLRERFDSVGSLAGYGGPVAFLVAGEDEVVPAELGKKTARRLFRAQMAACGTALRT